MKELLKGLLWDAMTMALTFGLYIAFAVGLQIFWSDYFLWFDLVSALDLTQSLMVIFCFWQITFGPYSRTLKRVAKYLPKGRKAKETEDYT